MAQAQEQVAIFIDNSNLWLEGTKAISGSRVLDSSWRINFGLLTQQVRRNRPLAIAPHLYGSFSSETKNSNVWGAFHEIGGKVVPLRRSAITGREKMVDIAIATNIHTALIKVPSITTLVLVTGDGDFEPLLEDVLKMYDLKIEIWAWKDSLASALRALANDHPNRVTVNELNEFAREFGFHAPNSDSPLDPNDAFAFVVNKSALNENLLALMKGGHFRCCTLVGNPEVVAIVYDDYEVELHNGIIDHIMKIAPDLHMTPHAQWTRRPKKPTPFSPSMNRVAFAPTPIVCSEPAARDDADKWTVVTNRQHMQHAEPEGRCVVGGKLCWYGAYCKNMTKCPRLHLRKDMESFARCKAKPIKKYVQCIDGKNCSRYSCNFLHPGEKKLCLTCGGSFLEPHAWGQCPLINKFSK